MNGIVAGIIGLIWVTIAVGIMIASFLLGPIVEAIVFLALIFATPFVLHKVTDII